MTPKHSRFIWNRKLADIDRGNFNLIHYHKLQKCVHALEAPWRFFISSEIKRKWDLEEVYFRLLFLCVRKLNLAPK